MNQVDMNYWFELLNENVDELVDCLQTAPIKHCYLVTSVFDFNLQYLSTRS